MGEAGTLHVMHLYQTWEMRGADGLLSSPP